jgi:hypothetical protein
MNLVPQTTVAVRLTNDRGSRLQRYESNRFWLRVSSSRVTRRFVQKHHSAG